MILGKVIYVEITDYNRNTLFGSKIKKRRQQHNVRGKKFRKTNTVKKIDNQTLSIKIFDNKMLMAILGEFNTNLAELEKLTDTKLFLEETL